MTLKEKKGTHEHTDLVTTSLLELLIAAKKITRLKSKENIIGETSELKDR